MFSKFLYSFLFITIMSFSNMAQSALYFEGVDLLEEVKEQGVDSLKERSQKGDGKAQYLLAHLYLNGSEGVEKDRSQAFELFNDALGNGVSEAAYYLGLMYCYSYGISRDQDKGISMIEVAAGDGMLSAQLKLSEIYINGFPWDRGVKDQEKAFYWSKESAENGSTLSMINLSHYYQVGRGVEENQDLAFQWIQKAVDEDDILAFEQAGDFYAEGIGTEQDLVRAYMMYDLGGTASSGKKAELEEQMTQAQIDEAVSLSRQWQEDHNSYRPSYHGLEAQGSDGHYEYH